MKEMELRAAAEASPGDAVQDALAAAGLLAPLADLHGVGPTLAKLLAEATGGDSAAPERLAVKTRFALWAWGAARRSKAAVVARAALSKG
jgi:hypothetical protein